MRGKGRENPLIYNYLKKYQEDPSSRVFAPLAEAYRKAGLVDEAIEIAREGLRIHPGFAGGRVALARALFDKREFAAVVDELATVVRDVPDNLIAQRLTAESCLILGRVAEALAAYKMLLYFAPQDTETARVVRELESQAYEKGALVLRKDPAPQQFAEKSAGSALADDPGLKRAEWMKRVQTLQDMLLKVERYKGRVSLRTLG